MIDQLARENECVTDGLAITGDQLDSVFYFPQHFQAIRDVFQQAKATKPIETLWANRTTTWGTVAPELGIGIPPSDVPINFIDNHDVPRFLYEGDLPGLHNALTFIFTAQGIPCIYYGTEQEFSGGNDPSNREDLWETGFEKSSSTFKHIQKLAKIRKEHAAIRKGGVTVTWSTERIGDEEDAGIFAYERSGGDAGDDYVLVIFNAHKTKESAPGFMGDPMMVGAAPGTTLTDVLGSGRSVTVGGDGSLVLDPPLGPQEALVLAP